MLPGSKDIGNVGVSPRLSLYQGMSRLLSSSSASKGGGESHWGGGGGGGELEALLLVLLVLLLALVQGRLARDVPRGRRRRATGCLKAGETPGSNSSSAETPFIMNAYR